MAYADLRINDQNVGHDNVIPVGLSSTVVDVTITRPADTNAYAAKDAVSNSTSAPTILTLTNAASHVGGNGYVVKVRAFTNSATAMLGAVFRLHLYNEAPTAVNDNAQFALLWANRTKRVGFIDLPALATEGTGSDAAAALWVDLPLHFDCASNDRNLYCIPELLTTGAAPASGQQILFSFNLEQH